MSDLPSRRSQHRERNPHLPDRVTIVDCTLRDGEQAAGVWFTVEEKLALARLLDRAGVDVLDAGFPASCAEEVEVLQELRRAGLTARIGATARPVAGDLAAAERARAEEVFLFLPTSRLRLEGLGMAAETAERRLQAGVEEGLARGMEVNVVAEDASRADRGWLLQLLEGLLRWPIRRVVLCDTVGSAFPQQLQSFVESVGQALGEGVDLCMHCHNDFGLATANTLAGVLGGARSVSCTVNGIGERAGNADLAEVVAALEHLLGVEHGVRPELLPDLSTGVERASGLHTSPLKPVTGSNVYSHESGVHVDGMLGDPRSYEFLPAAWTKRQSRIVLGKHSGTSSVAHFLGPAARLLPGERLRELLGQVKRASQQRSKAVFTRFHDEVAAFRANALAGLDPAWLLQRAEQPPGERPATATDGRADHAPMRPAGWS